MKFIVAAVGRLKAGSERNLYERYAKRLASAGKAAGLGPLETIEISESRKSSAPERKAEESAALLSRMPENGRLVVLDEKGKGFTSKEFAKMIARERDDGAPCMTFAIGGADGHGETIREAAAYRLSLGPMTLAYGLARVVLAEQIYRAVTILTGHPYHRE